MKPITHPSATPSLLAVKKSIKIYNNYIYSPINIHNVVLYIDKLLVCYTGVIGTKPMFRVESVHAKVVRANCHKIHITINEVKKRSVVYIKSPYLKKVSRGIGTS